jgi:hypothetical protein
MQIAAEPSRKRTVAQPSTSPGIIILSRAEGCKLRHRTGVGQSVRVRHGVAGGLRESAKAMRSSSAIPRCRPSEERRVVLRQADLGDWSDPALVDDGVQPRPTRVGGRHRQRTQPQITRFTSREGLRLLQITLLYDLPNVSSKSPSSVQLCTFCAIRQRVSSNHVHNQQRDR